ncbi:MAG: methyltransferase domain-containing protein [Patescibacteria group bacterium]
MKKIIDKIIRFFGFNIVIRRVYSGRLSKDYARLEGNYENYKPLKLHFGCGPRVLKGWVNIDLVYTHCEKYLKYYTDKFYGPEIRGSKEDFYAIDITKCKLPLPDCSVDLIFHEDFIEHLSQRDQWVFLSETYRVLKKGGVHRVNTPDLLVSLEKRSDFSEGGRGLYTEEWDNNGHISVLTKGILRDMAESIGYSAINFCQRDKSTSKDIPKEYRPSEDRDSERGNIFADLIK